MITQLSTAHQTLADGTIHKTRYIATHEFLGQTVYDYDVARTTIVMGAI